jgi:two-component system, cell cycle response regulator
MNEAPVPAALRLDAPARVLVIEDDPLTRRTHAEALIAAGHLVDTAEDGQAGFEKVLASRPDIVLTDWMMPRMDGVTLCRLVKGHEELRSTYVIILSTRGETIAKVTGLDLGADEYLVKPVDVNELLARVRSGLRLRRALMELAAKNELLERLALTDSLTSLPNRRAYEESLTSEISRALRHCKPLSLLYLDLDRFKEINDAHGHPIGDEVLVGFADLLRRHARRGDLAARIGGEEFAVLLPHTARQNAALVAERIRKALESAPVGRTRPVALTTSIGVAVFTGEGVADAAEFAKRADDALYRAKSEGRNRVALAPE